MCAAEKAEAAPLYPKRTNTGHQEREGTFGL
jgi:hypothetical protein